jgi:hypothetical protein
MHKFATAMLFAALAWLAFGIETASHAEQFKSIGGKCLDVGEGRTTNGARVLIWPCGEGYPNQRWDFVGDTLRGIGGKCLDVANGNTANGAQVVMWDCHPDSANQRWTYRDGQLIGFDGKCLDVTGGSTDSGTAVIMWDCHGGPNQIWARLPSIIGPGR